MPSGRSIIFPESGRGLSHVTPTILGIRSNISQTTWATDFKFGMQLCMGNAEQVHK